MAEAEHGDSVYRPAAYVGSFAVAEVDPRGRTDKVQRELEALRVHDKERQVIICVSVKGIKICSGDRSVVFMAHALRRISYATCDATHRQFAFLAREPLDEVNNQYCHVFVTESPAQAEELNRIVGDAFQLAYVQQLLLKQQRQNLHRTPHLAGNNNNAAVGLAVPKLCDRHPRWPRTSPSSTNRQQSLLNVLELPPPPNCPPPPPVAQQPSVAGVRVRSPNRLIAREPDPAIQGADSSPTTPLTKAAVNSTGEEAQLGFRKRAVLNRQNEIRLPGLSDAQILGGSTRQPRRRQGLGWTHLFASARHSAFIPGTQQKNQPPTSPDLLELLDSRRMSPRKTNIFLDLRTFTGRSPVVALKERLDAQAIADAKASAFAETAAVLAAAKKANSVSSASPTNSSPKADPCSSGENSASPGSTTSAHSEPSRILDVSSDPNDTPPEPPIRVFSLRRGRNHPSPTQKHPQSESMFERLYDEADTGTDEFHRNPPHRAARDGCIPRAFKQTHSAADVVNSSLHNPSHAQSNAGHHWTNENGQFNKSSQPVFVRDHRVHQRPRFDQNSASPTQGPLHVTVSKASCPPGFMTSGKPCVPTNGAQSQGFGDTSSMTTSTISTETPTPTATPTPTPMQTPQPANNGVTNRHLSVWDTPEDAEFLKHAPWYQAHLPRDVAFELLAREEPGSFIVRNSISHPDCCALSVRVPLHENSTGITHYLIQRTPHGIRLKGLEKWWPSLKALITHLTVIPEMLPCPLRLPQCISNPVFIQTEARHTKSDNKVTLTVDKCETGSQPNDARASNWNSLPQSDVTGLSNLSAPGPTSDRSTRPESICISDSEDFQDEEYQRLSDFSSILADLEPRSLTSSC